MDALENAVAAPELASVSEPACDVLIAGGGTAGHTNPGIAIGQALVAAGLPAARVRFAGSQRGNESELVPAAGFSIDTLSGRGIPRSISLASVKAALQTIRGFGQAIGLVRKRRPKVIVCLGGYAAFGPSMAGILLRIPVVVSEQNARASDVNRLVGRWAKRCALPFEGTDLPHGVVTGNPIRSEFAEAVASIDERAARKTLDLPADVAVVAVWSGSLGATSINEAVRHLAVRWADRTDVVIYHVVGRRDWDAFGQIPESLESAALDYRTIEYERRMPHVLTAATMAVCRSGASTVAELAVAGLPAILVPLPGAPRDHQTANAQQLADPGGSVLLDQKNLSADRLDELLTSWLENRDALARTAEALAEVAFPGAAKDVAALVIEAGGIHV